MIRRLWPLCVLTLALACQAKDTVPVQYSSRLWQTDDGLPHNSVQVITQTRDGYLWVGTPDGLCRFDGVHFTVLDETIAPELKARWFSALRQTSDGALWIGTDGAGLFCVKDQALTHFSKTNGLAGDSIRTIYEGRDGAIWIGTGNGLSRYRNGQFTTFRKTHGLAQDVVRSVCEDDKGTLWIATGEGLNSLKNDRVTATYQYSNNQNSLAHNSVRCVLLDHSGVLWIGSNGGLSRFQNGTFQNFTEKDGLLDLTVSALYEDHEGVLWVGTFGGLHRMSNGRPVPLPNSDGEIYDAIYSLHEDSEGDLWVGTNAGLYRVKKRRFASLTKQDGLSHNTTVSVLADTNNSVWIGTWGGALNRWNEGKVEVRHASEVLPFYFVLAMAKSRTGHLWLGTDYDEGLYRFDETGGAVTRWGKEHGFIDAAISVIHEDKENTLWIGTRTALVRMKEDHFTRFTKSDGLPSSTIKAICEDGEGQLWIGTQEGLARRSGDRFGAFESINLGDTPHAVCALYSDADGNLWIGTKGAGLMRMRAGKISRYTTSVGLFANDVFEIIEQKGDLWMTCAKGIFRVNKKNFEAIDHDLISRVHCVSYDKSDGLVSVDCKGVAKPSACKTGDGRLCFATGKGVAVAEADLKINERPPTVYIETIIANKSPLLQRTLLEHSQPDHLKIPAGTGDLEIHYTALSFQAPEKNRFRYKLEGIDSDWVDAGARRVAYYNQLPPGHYTFLVAASNNDGVWNDKGATLGLIWLPHVWQTTPFKLFVAAIIAFGLGGIYRLRIARLREIERLRVRIAGDLHDEVGSSLWSISLLSRMLQKSAALSDSDKHDALEINRIAVQTANSIRDIVWFINPDYDTMHDLLLRMRDVANTMLSGVDHHFDAPVGAQMRKLPLEFRQNVFLMFKEILANIARHSEATVVTIKVSETAGQWQMSIHDNGRGFDPKRITSGHGLQNLRNRSEKLKGQLDIRSDAHNGTEITFSMRLE